MRTARPSTPNEPEREHHRSDQGKHHRAHHHDPRHNIETEAPWVCAGTGVHPEHPIERQKPSQDRQPEQQVTPGPLTQTVAVVGYAAGGFPAALLAAFVAFLPSFSFILFGAARFERLLLDERVTAFLAGAAPAAAGASIDSAIPLAGALSETWQYVVLAAAAIALLALRRSIVLTLLTAGTVGGRACGCPDSPLEPPVCRS